MKLVAWSLATISFLAVCGCGSDELEPTVAPAPVTITVTETASPSPATSPSPAASSERSSTTAAPTQTLKGTLQLFVNRNPNSPDNCVGFEEEGYGDVYSGQQVVLLSGNNETIAVGALGTCKFSPMDGPNQARGILFDFLVKDVPEVQFLKIRVGQRGEVTYTWSQLAEANWRVPLTL